MPKLSQWADRASRKLLVKSKSLHQLYGDSLSKLSVIEQEEFATPELSQLPSFIPRLTSIDRENYQIPEIFTTVLHDVLYCPQHNVILTPDRQVIAESVIPGPIAAHSHCRWQNLFQFKVDSISGYCSVFRGHPSGYYHTLIENIPRVSLLDHPEYAAIPDIKLLCPDPPTAVERALLERLLPSNVTLSPVASDRLYAIEHLIFPSFLSHRGTPYLPPYYLEKLRSQVLPQRRREKKHRILISRAKSASNDRKRHILNEVELCNELSKLGFKRYILEDLSIMDKVELFYDAEMVVAPFGAGESHLVFSEGISYLCLNATATNIYPHTYYLCKALGHRLQYWFGPQPEIHENFIVNIPEVLELVSSAQFKVGSYS
jgi:capsular polysaccharide biosynthesis protein